MKYNLLEIFNLILFSLYFIGFAYLVLRTLKSKLKVNILSIYSYTKTILKESILNIIDYLTYYKYRMWLYYFPS